MKLLLRFALLSSLLAIVLYPDQHSVACMTKPVRHILSYHDSLHNVLACAPRVTPAPTATPAPTPTPSPTPTPTATPTPGPAPAHILSWAYDENGAQGTSATGAQVRQYLNYAEGGLGNGKAVTDCDGVPGSCVSVAYTDPNKIYAYAHCPDPSYAWFTGASSETWYVHHTSVRVQGHYTHTCSGTSYSEPVYVATQDNTSVQTAFNHYIHTSLDSWDDLFMDDTAGTIGDQMYGPGGGFCGGSICTTTDEYTTNPQIVTQHASMANAITHVNGTHQPIIFNGLAFDGGSVANNWAMLNSTSRFAAAVCENCLVNAGTIVTSGVLPMLNTMEKINDSTSGAVVLLNTGSSSAGSAAQINQRTFALAVAWLGFKPGQTIVWPDFEYNTTNLAFWPEQMIYPTAPVQTMSTGGSDLLVATGVYRREFTTCYKNGVSIGGCAAIVNTTGSAVTISAGWFSGTVSSQITMTGGDILSGGAVSNPSAPATVPAGQAVLLAL